MRRSPPSMAATPASSRTETTIVARMNSRRLDILRTHLILACSANSARASVIMETGFLMASTLDSIQRRVYEGVNYRLRSFANGRFAAHCRPTSIIFLLTELCNAKCIHCDIWKNRGKEDSPTVDQWKTLLTDLRRWL